jgi:hypothetical protein
MKTDVQLQKGVKADIAASLRRRSLRQAQDVAVDVRGGIDKTSFAA